MDFLVFIAFHLMDTLVLIVTCALVYRQRGCNKLELGLVEFFSKPDHATPSLKLLIFFLTNLSSLAAFAFINR